MKRVNLAIIGGGLVGASLALALQDEARRRGWQIVLVEPFTPGAGYQPSYDARSTALSYGTQQIYQRLGLWPAISQRAAWKSSMACTWTAQDWRAAASTAAGSETRLSSHSATVQPSGR